MPQWLEEVAEFFATRPSRETMLAYYLSPMVTERAALLLERLSAGLLTDEEDRELQQFEHIELLMRLIKARLQQEGHE